ncbi:hypothetical protein AOLI_G00183410 [Acnodon oligacanthus]
MERFYGRTPFLLILSNRLAWMKSMLFPATFVFTLPKGLCKNDRNHDVRLKVEAICVTDSDVKAGEGFFAIYPRTNAPRINLFTEPEEELYQYSGMMALLRVQNDYLAMHCGCLLYSVAFHEARPVVMLNEINSSSLPVEQVSLSGDLEKLQDAECASSTPWSPGPVWNSEDHPDAKIDLSSETLPLSPSSETPTEQPEDKMPDSNSLALFSHDYTPSQSPLPLPYTHVSESLLRRASASLSFSPTYAHVSRPGDEIISVTVHGATSLPPLRDGSTPLPFAALRIGVHGRQRSQAVTQCPLQPTHNPCWEENLSVELLDVEAHREGQCPRGCDCMLPWCVNSATSPGSPASPSLALRCCCNPWTVL